MSHLRVFGCRCFVHNNGKDNLGKFDAKSDEAIFLGYSLHSKAYRVFNNRTRTMEESPHVVFDEINTRLARKKFVDDIVESLERVHIDDEQEETPKDTNSIEEESQHEEEESSRELRISKNHPLENVIGNINQGVTT